jgi:hypothetical protein
MKNLKKLIFAISICAITYVNAQQPPKCDLELRGVLEINNNYQFSLRSKNSEQSTWASLNRTALGYRLISYNEEHQELTLSSSDITYKIKIKQSDDKALALLKETTMADEYAISTADIDPDVPGQQSYNQIRSKLKFHVSARNNNSLKSIDLRGQSGTTTSEAEANTSSNVDNSIELTEAEVIALQSYDKNYVASRELPNDVVIKYAVSPR